MILKIEIDLDNDAFEEHGATSEVYRILTQLCGHYASDGFIERLSLLPDINGNIVGKAELIGGE